MGNASSVINIRSQTQTNSNALMQVVMRNKKLSLVASVLIVILIREPKGSITRYVLLTFALTTI